VAHATEGPDVMTSLLIIGRPIGDRVDVHGDNMSPRSDLSRSHPIYVPVGQGSA